MARTATVKCGDAEAVYDGERFTSEDESVANVLNSALAYFMGGGRISKHNLPYEPDDFVGIARSIAEYCGGTLIAFDPPEGIEPSEDAIF